jgi:NAD+ synthase (glutamine-hydrolysing)
MRILMAQINPIVGAIDDNTEKVLKSIAHAKSCAADLVLFPELCLSGYPPEDFLLLPHFIDAIDRALHRVVEAASNIAVVVGLPRHNPEGREKKLYNSAAILYDRHILGFQDKVLLPTYDVFDERRYFEPAFDSKIWTLFEKKVAITICEDIWQHAESIKFTSYHRDPIVELIPASPDLLLNLSASPYSTSKFENRAKVASYAAKDLNCPLLLCNQVGGNDSLIFDGRSLYMGRDGAFLGYAKGFEEDMFLVDLSLPAKPTPFVEEVNRDLFQALVLGVRDYFHKSGFYRACLGLSGGVDSALVACIAVEALGKENVLAVMMPSRFSSSAGSSDALKLIDTLGIAYREIPIESIYEGYLKLLSPHFENRSFDATEENLQARIRGMILMALSNKLGYIVLSTGNKSELAMGYSTLYGDMCGGLSVINDVTKQQVYALSHWINREKEIIPWNTIYRPPSAELRPNQKDTDSLPDYAIVDNVLQAYVEEHLSPQEISQRFGYTRELVNDLISRIHRNEYKRRQSPPGLRISEKAFSVGRRFPIVQAFVKTQTE